MTANTAALNAALNGKDDDHDHGDDESSYNSVGIGTDDDDDSVLNDLNGKRNTRGGGHKNDTATAAATSEEVAGEKESAVVSRWRCMVIFMLLVTAALVVTSTYKFLSLAKQQEFEKSFQFSANTIMDAAEFTARSNIQTIVALADSLTSEALTQNATWPFFTSNNFEIKAANARINSYSEVIMFMPFVPGLLRQDWEEYALSHQGWIPQSRTQGLQTAQWEQKNEHFFGSIRPDVEGEEEEEDRGESRRDRQRELQIDDANSLNPNGIGQWIYTKVEDNPGGRPGDVSPTVDIDRLHYAPVWQVSPPPMKPSIINYNFLGDSVSARLFNAIKASGGQVVVSEILKPSSVDFFYNNLMTTKQHAKYHDQSQQSGAAGTAAGDAALSPGSFPHALSMAPVYKDFNQTSNRESSDTVVGYVCGFAPWDLYLSRLLPEGVNGVYAVLSNSCAQTVTYLINGPIATYLGEGDLHQPQYDSLKQRLDFTGFGSSTEESRRVGQCDYSLTLYASDVYQSGYDNDQAIFFACVLAGVFIVTGLFFVVFVFYVQRRQNLVMATALKTSAIVASLFPSNVTARIMQDAEVKMKEQQERPKRKGMGKKWSLEQHDLIDVSNRGADGETIGGTGGGKKHVDTDHCFGSKPIADLFPETTLLFADLVGFTAWSSVREPTQVFTLLETIYHAFDQLAKKYRVFKVETVGDCYVAAAGLPEPRKDHAVIMARFARECQFIFGPMVKRLEVSLGPDTGDLNMRFGLHSGPVTAGVLRGERSRFQLFGDTVNTCSRIETNGMAGRIHISREMADILIANGKGHWVKPRTEKVNAKGKGELNTCWLLAKSAHTAATSVSGASTTTRSGAGSGGDEEVAFAQNNGSQLSHQIAAKQNHPNLAAFDDKTMRLINWNVDIFLRMLRQVESRRRAIKVRTSSLARMDSKAGCCVIDEVREIVHLPAFNVDSVECEVEPDSIDLGRDIEDELRHFIGAIAMMYRANPFHCFEHASHVTMSVVKLMSRIVNPLADYVGDAKSNALTLHDHTYGITSDPLTQFACIFSALIHDVDHEGVTNQQLIKENAHIATLYKNKSIAEQNSVVLAWDLLMNECYSNLQKAIFINDDELRRFRALVINAVMATDIMDSGLKALRNARWEKAFAVTAEAEQESPKDVVDRKATIVIEHMIQASDVAHTMQHWHVYRRWNERLFTEMYQAYKAGRAENNPADNWYQGEIGFFDFYIIPLAKKLHACGVFGVSSVEYLTYAEKNRQEWIEKGQQVVAEMIDTLQKHTESEMKSQPEECRLPKQGRTGTIETTQGPNEVAASFIEV